MVVSTLCVFGTRPEAIKMAPVVRALEAHPLIRNSVCVTGQHEEMLTSVLDLFSIKPDYSLHLMEPDQSLANLTSRILQGMELVLKQVKPDIILVHGDTTTTLAASLSAYYNHIPVAHIEAGLRTGNIYKPWPEEVNRKLTGALTALHFSPTEWARQNLLNEGVDSDSIFVTGNTVIDALNLMVAKLEANPALVQQLRERLPDVAPHKKMILVTGHRRESFGDGFERICQALVILAKQFPEVDIIYPVHLNPHVQGPVKSMLRGIANIHLIEPVDYLSFVYLMKSSYLILTDSGGVQEEAPSLGKPLLVMRDLTERPEALALDAMVLVGTDIEKIVNSVTRLLLDDAHYKRMSNGINPYGDGAAGKRIVESIVDQIDKVKDKIVNTNRSKLLIEKQSKYSVLES